MINFKFLKTQIKSSIWIAFGISVIFIIFSIGCMSAAKYFFDTEFESEHSNVSYDGGIRLLGLTTIFGTVGEILALVFAVVLAIKLINIEISKGYMASWLNLPMTRATFFAAKILAILIGLVIIVLPNLLVELIIAGIKYPDFNLVAAGILLKANFGLLLVFLLVSSITVTFSIIFNQTSHALTLSIVVPLFFILLFLLSSIAKFFNAPFLENLRYFTFFTFYDFKQLMQPNDKNFIWKFCLLVIFSSSLFFFSGYWFNKKNLYI